MRRRPMKFLSVAVALAALPFLALAQAPAEPPKPPLYSIYGTLDANLHYTTATGATTPTEDVAGRTSVSFDSSNIGIRGTLMVDDYIGATYQCETAASGDGIAGAVLCNRNSRIGLTGNWGTLWYGNWDTPFKAAAYGTKADDPFNKTDVYGFQSIMGSPGFNYRSGTWASTNDPRITGFDIRAQNSVGYWSPKFYGVSLKLQYSVNEFMTPNATRDPWLAGAVLNWDYGPFSILAAYETHHDGYALVAINGAPNTSAQHSTDWAWRAGAGYQFDFTGGNATLSAMADQLTLEQKDATAVGAATKYVRLAWQVALKLRFGDHELRARYSTADDGKLTGVAAPGVLATVDATDFGASMLALGYAYWIAPSLNVYLHYAQITNKPNAQYTFTIGGSPAVAGGTPAGADPMAIGLGTRYTF